MLSKKQIRMLQLLDKSIGSCTACDLHRNGRCAPKWSPNSKYVIIGESPNYGDVRRQSFFNGRSGSILVNELGEAGFTASQFLMINSVQCMSMRSNRKPTGAQLDACGEYLRKYIKVLNPEKILCLGNYAKYIFTRDIIGVLKQRKKFHMFSFKNDNIEYPTLITINPAYCVYNEEEGLAMLKEDILFFKESKFERKSDWFFTENDFLI